MKNIILTILFIQTFSYTFGQLEIDLSKKLHTTQFIDFNKAKPLVIIKNMCLDPSYSYSYEISVKEEKIPTFDLSALAAAPCNEDTVALNFNTNFLSRLTSAQQESEVADLIIKINKQIERIEKIDKKKYEKCMSYARKLIESTATSDFILFDVKANQTITVIVKRIFKNASGNEETISWTKIFKTEVKTPWLIHYGLTYSPNFISKTKKYFSKADPSVANKYVITEENDNGPKAWENISATMNFTYPFTKKERDVKIGFTGGFGLNPTLQLSGHTGLSAIFGENIILSSGIVIMQKYQLKGEYSGNGQDILKENLAFDSLHKKVWLPELYITIGFRFEKNPFEKKSEPAKEKEE